MCDPDIDWAAGVHDDSRRSWTTTPPATVPRNYHSVALLLPNGLVRTAGSKRTASPGATPARSTASRPSFDGDQRYVGVEFDLAGPGPIEAVAPPHGGVAPRGPYLLWVVDDDDRPCELGAFVRLG